jgi:hypothetical protein
MSIDAQELAEQPDTKRRVFPKRVALEDGALALEALDDTKALVEQAFGTDCGEFKAYCLTQLVNILPNKGAEDFTIDVNAALAMLTAINPANELEAMLAVQMVASNHLALISTRRALRNDTVEGRQMNGNLATKASRTFTAQLEALNRHRRGGKQIVEHVHINAGGQAVIAGTVNASRQGA